MNLFSHGGRTDHSHRRANEPYFTFLDRAAPDFFVPVRELLQSWLDALPPEHRNGVAGNLTSGDDKGFEQAFWELYLHRTLTRAGLEVTIHPDVRGSTKHPDFLVRADEPFYLEAVGVGSPAGVKARDRRLADVEAVLKRTKSDGWTLSYECNNIGPDSLDAKALARELLAWIATLGPAAQAAQVLESVAAYGPEYRLPTYPFGDDDVDGWDIDFTALPVGVDGAPLAPAGGRGRPGSPNNRLGLARALEKKASRYGHDLDYPLVTAVLSNTDRATSPDEIQLALFGEPWPPSQDRDRQGERQTQDGHWRRRSGWRRAHNPYVIVGSGISLNTLHKRRPSSWRTADPAATGDLDLSWTTIVDGSRSTRDVVDQPPDLDLLGIGPDWCATLPDYRS